MYKKFIAKNALPEDDSTLEVFIRDHPYKSEDSNEPQNLLAPGFLICGPKTEALAQWVTRIARVSNHVIIYGETGTGKEGVARAIHALSPRSNEPFVTVNCASLRSDTAGSELFGHRRGAFTNAFTSNQGLFCAAHGGVLVLDELDLLPEEVQGALLRALQDGEVRGVGELEASITDVRVIATTKVPFNRITEEGPIRPDFFYRLPCRVSLEPLRDRPEEIPELVRYYVQKLADEEVLIDDIAMQLLMRYTWPGNIRELVNVITVALIMQDDARIRVIHLPEEIRSLSALDKKTKRSRSA